MDHQEPPPKSRRGAFSRWARRLVVFLLVVPVLVLLGLNLFVNSDSVRKRVSDRAETSLGFPLRFEKARYWPWSGMRLTGFLLAPAEENSGPSAESTTTKGGFEIASIEVRPRLLSFLSPTIELAEVRIGAPRLTAVRDETGKIHLPLQLPSFPPALAMHPPPAVAQENGPDPIRRKEIGPATPVVVGSELPTQGERQLGPVVAPRPGNGTPTPQPSPVEATPVPAESRLGLRLGSSGRQLAVDAVTVDQGGFAFQVAGLQDPAFEIHGASLVLDSEVSDHPSGEVRIEKITILGQPVSGEIRAQIDLTEGVVRLHQIEGEILGGTLSGQVALRVRNAGRPFQYSIHLRDADPGLTSPIVAELTRIADLDSSVAVSGGQFSLSSAGGGLAAFPPSWKTKSKVYADSFAIEGLGSRLPSAAAAGADASSLRNLPVMVAEAELLTHGHVLHVPNLRLKTEPGVVRGVAGVRIDRSLFGEVRVYASEEMATFFDRIRSTPPEVSAFVPFEETTWRAQSFRLSGSLGEPRCDFWQPGLPLTLGESIAAIENASRPAANPPSSTQ